MSDLTPSWRPFLILVTILLILALELYFVPHGWNFALGLVLISGIFFLPEWWEGGARGVFLKNPQGEYEVGKVQFYAWFTVTASGLAAIFMARLRDGVINPLGLNIDLALPLLALTSYLVLLTAVHPEWISGWFGKSGGSPHLEPLPESWYLIELQFRLFTLLLLLLIETPKTGPG